MQKNLNHVLLFSVNVIGPILIQKLDTSAVSVLRRAIAKLSNVGQLVSCFGRHV
jgi:hypothetical protein